MYTTELKSTEARKKIKIGVDRVADAVKLTLGPEGRNVLLVRDYHQIPTKDGVTVAQAINPEDKYEKAGADAVKEAAENTNKSGGDGTTVTTILTQAMVDQGFSAVESGVSPVSLVRGIKKAVQFVSDFLDKSSIQIRDYDSIKNVASISANDVEMGKNIADLFHKLGKDGVIVVEESKIVGYEQEYIKGLKWDKPMVSPYFMTDYVKRRAEIDNPYILLTDEPIDNSEYIYNILQKLDSVGERKLVVICNDLTGHALNALVVNNVNIIQNNKRGTFKTLAVRAPYTAQSQLDALEDMAVLIGATVVSKAKGMALWAKPEDVDLSFFGRAAKVISDPLSTVIIGGKGKQSKIKERIKRIKADLKDEERDWEKQKLKERLARLTGEVAVLRFGAENESLVKEMKYRIEDSINATRNALEEGIVAGGEVAILRASQELLKFQVPADEARGVEIVRQALTQPITVLAENAGNTGNQVIKRVLESSNRHFGWDASKDEYCDLVKRGILDPKKVVKAAVVNAAAITSMLLMTESVAVEREEPKQNK